MNSHRARISLVTEKRRAVKGRKLDVLKDVPDVRDRLYEPTLSPLPPEWPAPRKLFVNVFNGEPLRDNSPSTSHVGRPQVSLSQGA